MDTCFVCRGAVDLTTRRCQQCGRLQPTQLNAPPIPAVQGAVATQTQRCLHCGAEVPQWMRYCGYCGRLLSLLAERAPDSGSPPSEPSVSSGPGGANPPQTLPMPLGKKIIAGVGIVVLAAMITVALTQGSALLRRGASASASPSALPAHLLPAAGAPGTISEVPLPTRGAIPFSITSGPDGNLWFTELDNNGKIKNIGRITPQGMITEFPVFTTSGGPLSITAGPDGNLWFTEAGNQMGYITPQGLVSLMPLPDEDPVNTPDGIAAGPDGNLWITLNGAIGRLSPVLAGTDVGESLTVFPFPKQGSVNYAAYATYTAYGITAGPDGNLWFTMFTTVSDDPSAVIGRITPHGAITVFPLPPTWHDVESIAKGPDGNLWFTGNLSEAQDQGDSNADTAYHQATVSRLPVLDHRQ